MIFCSLYPQKNSISDLAREGHRGRRDSHRCLVAIKHQTLRILKNSNAAQYSEHKQVVSNEASADSLSMANQCQCSTVALPIGLFTPAPTFPLSPRLRRNLHHTHPSVWPEGVPDPHSTSLSISPPKSQCCLSTFPP